MSKWMRQIEKAVDKFMEDDNKRLPWHEAAHMMLFRELKPESKPFFCILPDGGVGVDFKNKPSMDTDYMIALAAGYAGELMYLNKTVDYALIRGVSERLLKSVRTMYSMNLMTDNDDYKFFILSHFSDKAEKLLTETIEHVITFLKANKEAYMNVITEFEETHLQAIDNKDYLKGIRKIQA